MTHEEFLAKYTYYGYNPDLDNLGPFTYFEENRNSKAIPDSVDWIAKGYVNRAKNQGNCGSCYAFASIGALEGQIKKEFDQLLRLSTQQVTSCYPTNGCDGGNAQTVYSYINRAGGIVEESNYPYTSGFTNQNAGTCQTLDNRDIVAKVLSTVKVCDNLNKDPECTDESRLTEAIANNGPVYVTILSAAPGFQSYAEGVFSWDGYTCCKTDHAVLAVGYGNDEKTNKPYYTIMNSWGASWGNRGTARIARNSNFMIGIGNQVYYPQVDKTYKPPKQYLPPPRVDIKTDSLIFKAGEDDRLLSAIGAATLTLLYRGSRDGFLYRDFWSKVNGKTNTVIVVKPKTYDYVFGGFLAAAWTTGFIDDNSAFIYSLRRDGVTSFVKFGLKDETCFAIGSSTSSIRFGSKGSDMQLYDDFDSKNNHVIAGCKCFACPDDTNQPKNYFVGTNGGFVVQEIEVFQKILRN